MSSDSHYVAERAFAQRLDDLYYKGVYCPMPTLMYVRLDSCFATSRVPGVLAIGLCTERCSLLAQKQGDGMEIDHLALC